MHMQPVEELDLSYHSRNMWHLTGFLNCGNSLFSNSLASERGPQGSMDSLFLCRLDSSRCFVLCVSTKTLWRLGLKGEMHLLDWIMGMSRTDSCSLPFESGAPT